jgi:hypothetical protein
LLHLDYSDLYIVQAPYAIAPYATKAAIGLNIRNAIPASTNTAPSSVVLSSNLFFIHVLKRKILPFRQAK